MPGVITRLIPHLVQPQYPVGIDRSNPLTVGLSGVFSPLTSGGMRNLVAGVFPTSDTGTLRVTRKGVLRDYVSGQKSTFANRADYGLAGAMTIVVIADVDTLTNYGALVSCQDTTTTNGWELRLGFGVTDSRILMHRANTDLRQYTAAASNLILAGSLNNFIAVTFPSAAVDTAPTYNINGVQYFGALISGSATGAAIASTSTLDIGARASGGTQLDGGVQLVLLWNRALSFAELEQIRANPWQIFPPLEREIYVVSAGGDVTLSPGLFTDADAFYAATVTPGVVTLTPGLYTDPDTFYAASLQSSIALSPALFTDADTLYGAALQASIGLSPALFTDADTFYTHMVTAGTVTLTPTLFTDADTFYTHVLSVPTSQTLTASLFTDPDTFYAASISSGRQGGGWETYVAPRRRKTLEQYKEEYSELPYIEIVDKKEEVKAEVAQIQAEITRVQAEVEFRPDAGLITRLKAAIETQKVKLRALKWVEETKRERVEETKRERVVHDDLVYIVAYLLGDEDEDD